MYPPKYVPTPSATVDNSLMTLLGASILVRINEKNNRTSIVIKKPARIAAKTNKISFFIDDDEERLLELVSKKIPPKA